MPARTYIDTSVFMALVTREPQSENMLQWLHDCQWADLAASPWLRTELASALAVKQRMRKLGAQQARQAHENGLALLSHIPCLEPITADYDRAAELCADPAARLRASDALHLAVAERGGCAALACLDADMQTAAYSDRKSVV